MSLPSETDATRGPIDRPLGMNRPDPKTASGRGFRPFSHGAPLLLSLILLGGSIWTARHQDPLRKASELEETALARAPEPEQQIDPAVTEPKAEPNNPATTRIQSPIQRSGSGSGPAIIRVAPDSDTLPDLADGENPADSGGAIIIRDAAALSAPMRLSSRPEPSLIEQTPQGPLPTIGPDGKRPFDAYRRPVEPVDGPAIALIVGGLGLSQTGTQYAIERLPGEVTLAFAPSGNSLQRWQQAAREGGHELLLQLPMEPFGYPNVSPGPGTLLADASPEETQRLTREAMSRITTYAGVVNYMGGRFLTQENAIGSVIDEAADRGLMFVDDGTVPGSRAAQLATKRGVPYARAGDALDNNRDPETIRRALTALEAKAMAGGPVIATASAFRATVEEISAWIDEAKSRGIHFVPVSALAQDSR
ncbi:divergent polysaccharide deacetylase family protein [Notoacmeibacter ruber]|uniref:Divergent polysaccharide deacetylase family protein n=1 Tax=Notoacmeibacter ruber TaxID=2670375 RepID=A0A3L7JF46_9HYPH|nr:divergent polysaccharide deacetylase family protein [Notoacmeibacter ruber]RLQ88949.1 divergent polysaccharide deacetylase family protein [Notoacmeibacter ruber]